MAASAGTPEHSGKHNIEESLPSALAWLIWVALRGFPLQQRLCIAAKAPVPLIYKLLPGQYHVHVGAPTLSAACKSQAIEVHPACFTFGAYTGNSLQAVACKTQICVDSLKLLLAAVSKGAYVRLGIGAPP